MELSTSRAVGYAQPPGLLVPAGAVVASVLAIPRGDSAAVLGRDIELRSGCELEPWLRATEMRRRSGTRSTACLDLLKNYRVLRTEDSVCHSTRAGSFFRVPAPPRNATRVPEHGLWIQDAKFCQMRNAAAGSCQPATPRPLTALL